MSSRASRSSGCSPVVVVAMAKPPPGSEILTDNRITFGKKFLVIVGELDHLTLR
jgi:hypothetical protein